MAVTLKQLEAVPATFPTVAGLSAEAEALDSEPLWLRIESYIVHRWRSRAVEWTIEGAGAWTPPLTPATISQAYFWTGTGWKADDLIPAPFGYCLDHQHTKVEATVGNTSTPPGDVLEAYRRLAEYLATPDIIGIPGVSRYTINVGQVDETISRRADHMAKVLVTSGAADLLRPYRRL